MQEHAELAVELPEPGKLTGLVPLRQGLQFSSDAVEFDKLSD